MKRPATTLATALLLLTGAYADEPAMDESVFQAPELTTPACGDEQAEEVVLPEKGFTHPFIKEVNRILFIMDPADTPTPPPILQSSATSPVQLEFVGYVRISDISRRFPHRLKYNLSGAKTPPDTIYACLIIRNRTETEVSWDDRGMGAPMLSAQDEEDPHFQKYRQPHGFCGTGMPGPIDPHGDNILLLPVYEALPGRVASLAIGVIDANGKTTRHLLRSQPLEEAEFTQLLSDRDISPAKAEVTIRPCPMTSYQGTRQIYVTYHNPTDRPIEIDHNGYSPTLTVTTASGEVYTIGSECDAPCILPAGMSFTDTVEFPVEASLEEDAPRIRGPRSNIHLESHGE